MTTLRERFLERLEKNNLKYCKTAEERFWNKKIIQLQEQVIDLKKRLNKLEGRGEKMMSIDGNPNEEKEELEIIREDLKGVVTKFNVFSKKGLTKRKIKTFYVENVDLKLLEKQVKRDTWDKIEKEMRKTHSKLSEGQQDGFEVVRNTLYKLMKKELKTK